MDVFLDFETRSRADVKKTGAWRYSQDPSTSILCLAWGIDAHPVKLVGKKGFDMAAVNPHHGMLNRLNELRPLAANPEVIFHAHNAIFEQCIWQNILVARFGWPSIPVERWRCTAAKAASFSLPRDLEGAGAALELDVQKDKVGHRVMLKLSKPRQNGEFWEYNDCPEDFETLYKYCIRDVEVEREVDKRLPNLSAKEQRVWFIDQKINLRGVQVDVPMVHKTMAFIEKTKDVLAEEFRELTDHKLNSPSQAIKLREWLADEGCELPDLQAATVDKAIRTEKDPTIKRVLKIRRDLSKTSLGKYPTILGRVDIHDGRLRDNYMYYAGITGRWGGRGVQLQNLPRGVVDNATAINFIDAGGHSFFEDVYGDPMAAYSSCIRGMFIPKPGHEFYVADFASIEARVTAWLAGQQDVLDIFRENGDLYCVEASQTFGRPITKADGLERSVGKVETLGLGFGGGINALGSMARTYSLDLRPVYSLLWPLATTDEQEKARFAYEGYLKRREKEGDPDPLDRASGYVADVIKQRWRRKNMNVVAYWDAVERAAIEAVLSGQKVTVAAGQGLPPITYGMAGEHLLAKLPSGNCLKYPFAQVHSKTNDWGKTKPTLSYKVQDEKTYAFGRKFTYGGRLFENLVQAVARDLFAEAMIRWEDAGFDLVLHSHDEGVAEEPEGAERLDDFIKIMSVVPEWADGLPVAAEGWKGKRYKK